MKQVAIYYADFTICVCTESSSAHFIRLPNNLNEKCDTALGWNKTWLTLKSNVTAGNRY